jgi:ribosomal protein L25 (general stress protein Ctc)
MPPIPKAFVPSIISGGSNLAGGLVNALNTNRQNKKSREFSERMYNLQKQDNIAFWNMQNEYNSPQAQMARFRQAGLNPLLVYGQGSSGNAGSVATPDVQQAQFRSPEFGNAIQGAGAGFINSFMDMEIKQAQADNIKADTTTKLSQSLLNSASRDTSVFNLGIEKEMRDVSLDLRREILRQTRENTQFRVDENERRKLLASKSLEEAAERILASEVGRKKAKAMINDINVSTQLKGLERDMRKLGLTFNDPLGQRLAAKAIDDVSELYMKSLQSKTKKGEKFNAPMLLERLYDDLFKDL